MRDGVNVGDEIRLSEFALKKRRNWEMVLRHGPEEVYRVTAKQIGILDIASSTSLSYKIPPTDVGMVVRRSQVLMSA